MTTWLWVSLACNLLLAIGFIVAVGRADSYRSANITLQKRVRSLEDPDPLCGCGHHISFHDEEEGCHFTVIHFREGRIGPRSSLASCQCVRYVGPEPLPRVIAFPRRDPE